MCKQQTQQRLPKPMPADVIPAAKTLRVARENFKSLGNDQSCPRSVTTHTPQHLNLNHYQSQRIRSRKGVNDDPDHKFEWYDLDAIQKADHDNNSNKHDFNAGMVFTTKRQLLSEIAQVNRISNTSFMSGTKANQQQQIFDFDLFFWAANKETTQDREFRERIEELEEEMKCDSSSPTLSSSFSSSSSSVLSSSSTSHWSRMKGPF